MIVSEEETLDSILGGGLELIQPRRGYRFSMEAVLLARFIQPKLRSRIIELGAGCGVISIIAAALYRPSELIALEIQPQLAEMIARNAVRNRIDVVRALNADLCARSISGLMPGSFDYAIANPPFRTAGSGQESPVAGRRMARGGGGAGLREFIAAAARYLKSGGTLGIVFVAARAAELLGELRERRLEPKRMRFIHPDAARPATAIMVEARKDAGVELTVEPPLIMYEGPGALSAQARALLEQAPATIQS